MYYDNFGLLRPPFQITPDTSLFFPDGDRQAILEGIAYALQKGEGMLKVVGEVGSGKTLLSRRLEETLPDRFSVVYLINPVIAARDILLAIATELGLPGCERLSPLELQSALQHYLMQLHAEKRQVVVIIDEAQAMPLQALEEIRLLGNLETATSKLLQIVLFGQPELDQHLDDPGVRQIKERITHHFVLRPFSSQEIRNYLGFRLHQTGYRGPEIFSYLAGRLISLFSRGLLRRVNIIADKSFLAAFASHSDRIRVEHIWAAAKDSNFIPRQLTILKGGGVVLLLLAMSLVLLPRELPSLSLFAGTGGGGIYAAEHVGTEGYILPEPAQVDTAPLIEPTPAVEPATGALPMQQLLDQRLEQTRKLLASEQRPAFSIQILQAKGSYKGKLERLLKEEIPTALLDEIYIYPLRHNNGTLLTVLYGAFDSFAEAQQRLQALPAVMHRSSPYIRNFPKQHALQDGLVLRLAEHSGEGTL